MPGSSGSTLDIPDPLQFLTSSPVFLTQLPGKPADILLRSIHILRASVLRVGQRDEVIIHVKVFPQSVSAALLFLVLVLFFYLFRCCFLSVLPVHTRSTIFAIMIILYLDSIPEPVDLMLVCHFVPNFNILIKAESGNLSHFFRSAYELNFRIMWLM